MCDAVQSFSGKSGSHTQALGVGFYTGTPTCQAGDARWRLSRDRQMPRELLLLHQPGFQEEATVSNPLMSFGKETLRIAQGEETLPLPLLLMSHCLRTSPSTKQALAAAPVFGPSLWRLPEAPAASLLPCTGPSSLRCSQRDPSSCRDTRLLEGPLST